MKLSFHAPLGLIFLGLFVGVGCGWARNGLGDDVSLTDSGFDDAGSDVDAPPPDSIERDGDEVATDVRFDDADADGAVWVRDGTYPVVKSVKGIVPDDVADTATIISGHPGRVFVAFDWASWEPTKKAPPCATTELEVDGHCFVVDAAVDSSVKAYTDAGIIVTALLYGTPGWANAIRVAGCTAVAHNCAPDDPHDFARFASAVATRYGDFHSAAVDHGRVSDFIVETLAQQKSNFDVGAPPAGTTLKVYWLDTYGALFVAAFDAISAATGETHVYAMLNSSLAADDLASPSPSLSPLTLLDGVQAKAGTRAWRTALQPAGTDPNFSPGDPATTVTFGTLAPFAGSLIARYGLPHAEILLVNGTFNSSPSTFDKISGTTDEAAQAAALCRAHRQIRGTPTIAGWLYYELRDVPSEVGAGFYFGLRRTTDAAKASWTKWASMDASVGPLDCGFEDMELVPMHRRFNGSVHWVTSRMAATGFADDATPNVFALARAPASDNRALFECVDAATGKHFVSFDVACEGKTPMGPLGFTWNASAAGRSEIFRCDRADDKDSLVSAAPSCEGYKLVTSLGWAEVK